jgi:type II secretory pathway pseudopilin PulG
MKSIIKLLALAATLAVVAIPVFAQSQECNEENKGTWYGTFYKNYKGDAAAQKVAYDAAKTYLGACPADPNDKQAAFMKKFVDLMDGLVGKANTGKAFQDAVTAKKYDDEMKYGKELLATDPDNVDVMSILGVAGLAQANLLNESAGYAEKSIQLIEAGKPLKAYTHDQGLAYLNWTIGKSKLASAPADAMPYLLKAAKLESEVKKNPQLYLDLSAAYETGPRAKLSTEYTASLNPDKTETAQSKVILENLNRVIDNQIDAMARAAALAPAEAKKTIVTDLSALYKYRNKGATDASVTELVANVLSKPIPDVPTPVTSVPSTPTPGATPAGTSGTNGNGATTGGKPAGNTTSTNNGGTKTGTGTGTTAPPSSKRPRLNHRRG